MQTVIVTNNGYDSILLINSDETVVGAWSPATKSNVMDYLRDGAEAHLWDANGPDCSKISDYGKEYGRDGVIDDESRADFWGISLTDVDIVPVEEEAEDAKRIAAVFGTQEEAERWALSTDFICSFLSRATGTRLFAITSNMEALQDKRDLFVIRNASSSQDEDEDDYDQEPPARGSEAWRLARNDGEADHDYDERED